MTHRDDSAVEIRAGLDHPVIDSDGHLIEFLPAVMTFLEELAGRKLVERYGAWMREYYAPTPERQRDRATAGLPSLLEQRMAELEFAVRELKMKVVMPATYVRRPVPQPSDVARVASRSGTTATGSTVHTTTIRFGRNASSSASIQSFIPARWGSERDVRFRATSTTTWATSPRPQRRPVALSSWAV